MRGHIRQRTKGTWTITLDVGTVDGKRKQKTVTVRGTKKQAQSELANLIRQIETGQYYEPSTMTVDEYLGLWIDKGKRGFITDRTINTYNQIKRRIRPIIGVVPISKLKPIAVQSCYRDLMDDGVSSNYCHQIHVMLKQAFRQAVKWGMLPSSPIDLVDAPRLTRYEPELLTAEQISRVIEHFSSKPYFRLAVHLAAYTGLRRSEVLALRWQDIDLDQAVITVRGQLQPVDNKLVIVPTKTRQARTVAITRQTVEELRQTKAEQLRIRLLSGGRYKTEYVCAYQDGRPIYPSTMSRVYTEAMQSLGFPPSRFHDLRHAHATMLLLANVDVKTVSLRLGHSQASTTLSIYAHSDLDAQRRALEAVSSALAIREQAGFGVPRKP